MAEKDQLALTGRDGQIFELGYTAQRCTKPTRRR